MVVGSVVLGKRAGRGALKLLKRPARFERRLVPKRGMRSDRVVIVSPERQLPAGKAFLDMLGVFAEFETNLRRERQMEGIAAAKARGVYKGRRPTLDVAEIRRLRAEGVGPTEIARRLGIGRASVYRALADDATYMGHNVRAEAEYI